MSKYSNEKLTREGFEKFLFALDENQEEAANKYLILREKLIRFFTYKHRSDSEDLTDKVLDRISIQIGEGLKINSIEAYCLGTARYVLSETIRNRGMLVNIDDIDITYNPLVIENHENSVYWDCLKECLEHLPKEERELIINYHAKRGSENLQFMQELAENLGVTSVSLRVRAHRIRNHLQTCLKKCKEKKM
jgi:DNA-directed RNA polymerase specialized sigma24 family protein